MKGGHLPTKIWAPILVTIIILLGLLTGYAIWSGVKDTVIENRDDLQEEIVEGVPRLETSAVIQGLQHVWDVAFAPDGSTYFTERGGDLSQLVDGQKKLLEHIPDVVSSGGEGGLMGMALDPEFSKNRYIYACFNTAEDVRLARWKVKSDSSGLEERKDLITGMPRKDAGGRHSGCRPRFGIDEYLWVATGDAAIGTNPQDPNTLGGKILRVDRDGDPAPDNFGDPFDPRVYSYGHRNSQGLAFYARPKAGVIGYSVEHGPDREDEVNELKRGNFGWDPVPGYNEAVPMTDKQKFPDAIEAIWKSGDSTIAPSGATILSGPEWKSWNGSLALALLKGRHVRILTFDENRKVNGETEILKDFGRIRSVVMGPDNALYFTTDNGENQDKIVKATPK